VRAGLFFTVFAPLELVTGYTLANPALVGNAYHDLFDGLGFLALGLLALGLARSHSHFLACWGRELVSLCMTVLTAGLTIWSIVSQSHGSTGLGQLIAALIIGPASAYANWYWHQRIHAAGDSRNRGFEFHLLADMAIGPIVALTSLAAYATGQAGWIVGGGWAIVGLVSLVALGMAALHSRFLTTHRQAHHHDH
jgi:Co/Zn/Cd efflux system component